MRLRSRGFTIIEAMLAMVILLVGILAVAKVFTAAVLVRQKGTNLAIAENVITAKFEEMRRTNYDLLRPRFEGAFDVTDPASPTRVIGTGQVTMTELGTVARVMKVTISVEAGRVRGPRTGLKSATYVAER